MGYFEALKGRTGGCPPAPTAGLLCMSTSRICCMLQLLEKGYEAMSRTLPYVPGVYGNRTEKKHLGYIMIYLSTVDHLVPELPL